MTPLEIEHQRVSEAYDAAWEARDLPKVTELLIEMWKLEDALQKERGHDA